MRRAYAKLLPLLLPLAGYIFLMHRVPNTVCTWDSSRPQEPGVTLTKLLAPSAEGGGRFIPASAGAGTGVGGGGGAVGDIGGGIVGGGVGLGGGIGSSGTGRGTAIGTVDMGFGIGSNIAGAGPGAAAAAKSAETAAAGVGRNFTRFSLHASKLSAREARFVVGAEGEDDGGAASAGAGAGGGVNNNNNNNNNNNDNNNNNAGGFVGSDNINNIGFDRGRRVSSVAAAAAAAAAAEQLDVEKLSPKFRQLHNLQRQQRLQEQRQLQEQLRQQHYRQQQQLNPPRTYGALHNIHPHQVFREYIFNCSNIHDIKIVRKVGHGVSKQTYLGTFRGMKVAVKMVTRHVSDIQSCLKRIREQGDNPNSMKIREKCFVFPTMKLMKEILLLEQLSHPNLIKLLGFCVRSEETDTTDLSEHGIIAVHEFGEHFMIENLRILPWQTRLKHAHQLVSLLQYLENSPIGTLRISDFKETHFLMVNNDRIKMIDMDDIHNIEPKCSTYNRPNLGFVAKDIQAHLGNPDNECEYSLPCRMALCLGFNAKFNLDRANAIFFKRLLFPSSFPVNITRRLEELNVELDTLSISTSDLLHELESIQLIADEILRNVKRKVRTRASH